MEEKCDGFHAGRFIPKDKSYKKDKNSSSLRVRAMAELKSSGSAGWCFFFA